MKLPEFYTKNPALWFRQVESKFGNWKITKSAEKFNIVYAFLPYESACLLLEDIDEKEEPYKELKKLLLGQLDLSPF